MNSIQMKMLTLAKETLENAYAPYSKFKVGACIRTHNNLFFTGCNVENTAYSLSICAEASALCQMVCKGERQIKEILVISSGKTICMPCGSCRQRLFEFGSAETIVHCCHIDGTYKTFSLGELLPHPFNADNAKNLRSS